MLTVSVVSSNDNGSCVREEGNCSKLNTNCQDDREILQWVKDLVVNDGDVEATSIPRAEKRKKAINRVCDVVSKVVSTISCMLKEGGRKGGESALHVFFSEEEARLERDPKTYVALFQAL